MECEVIFQIRNPERVFFEHEARGVEENHLLVRLGQKMEWLHVTKYLSVDFLEKKPSLYNLLGGGEKNA